MSEIKMVRPRKTVKAGVDVFPKGVVYKDPVPQPLLREVEEGSDLVEVLYEEKKSVPYTKPSGVMPRPKTKPTPKVEPEKAETKEVEDKE